MKELNGLITAYLKETDAVVPKANPNFGRQSDGDVAMAGWTTSKDAKLQLTDEVYLVTSTGADPFIITRELPAGTSPLTVEFKMKSNSHGVGQVFWMTANDKGFHRDRSVIFEPKHDNEWALYEIKLLADKPLIALRIDPSTAAGDIRLDAITLKDKDGKTLKTWAPRSQ